MVCFVSPVNSLESFALPTTSTSPDLVAGPIVRVWVVSVEGKGEEKDVPRESAPKPSQCIVALYLPFAVMVALTLDFPWIYVFARADGTVEGLLTASDIVTEGSVSSFSTIL